MTKQHFEAIAAILRDRKIDGDYAMEIDQDWAKGVTAATEATADDLADYFKSINPRFDRTRFLTACGF